MENQDPQKALKIVFFGTSEFAVPTLKSLINFGYHVTTVITQPEKATGRLRVLMPSPVKKAALENNIPVLEPNTLKNDEDFFKNFHRLSPDICIVTSYGKIIPARYLEVPKYGFLNIHPSLLPKYRGPSPIQTTIMNGDTLTGVSIMMMDKEVDHGAVLALKPYNLPPTAYYPQAEEDLAKIGAELLIETLPKYLAGEIQPKEQDHSQATFTNMISRTDGHINWDKSAEEIYNLVRSLNPEPGTWTTWTSPAGNSKTLNIKTAQATAIDCSGKTPGLVEKINNEIAVATQKCYLILKQIQLEGGKEMDAMTFLNGHPDFLNSKLE